MTQLVEHSRLRRIGIAVAAIGFSLVTLALAYPSEPADAEIHVFEGNCVGGTNSGVCVLDEPEGQNPEVHGLVAYLRANSAMTFTIDAVDRVTEVQICMQDTAPFEEGANVCAGSHGNHVAYQQVANIYTVDLVAEGFASTNPLYWTLHVVAGGRTLQVLGQTGPPPTTTTSTTTTTIPATTTTTVPGTTTTTVPGTTTTTVPGTTTTTAPATTTTTVPGTTTTTVPGTTTTTVPGTTTTTVPGTTTTAPATPTTTTSPTTIAPSTTTTLPVEVLGRDLARTGGPRWWSLLTGAGLLITGLTLVIATRLLDHTA